MRRPVGLDLNGWHDFACRDWTVEDGAASTLTTLDGGIASVVVDLDDRNAIGGPQAIHSPVGRGDGWGAIGAAASRRNFAETWQGLTVSTATAEADRTLRAAVDAISVQSDAVMLCMPDLPPMNENRQQRLLAALAGPRRPRATLLWRPVALLLALLDTGALPGADEGLRIACLLHGAGGLELQHLRLRRLADHPGRFAPERAGPGRLHCPELGLDALLADAAAAVRAGNPVLAGWQGDRPRLPAMLLFDPPPIPAEVVRRRNNTWELLHAPAGYAPPLAATAPPPVAADLAILLSPLAAPHRAALAEALARALPCRLIAADPDAAARGALHAARRIGLGVPHYFDRLDQISLAVQRPDGPAFADLIPAGATVRGNREYVSEPITAMVWQAGMAEANFFIRKGDREIRHWITPPVMPPPRPERLEIRLRQMPAQGWARLSVTAPGWDALRRAPIELDWSALAIDQRSEADILATLERPRPVVPERARRAADIRLWTGLPGYGGVRGALAALNVADSKSLKRLAGALRNAASDGKGAPKTHAVGTDGDLPDGLPVQDAERLDLAFDRIAGRLLQQARAGAALADNEALLCLTWGFARCPMAVQTEMIAALTAGAPHIFLTAQGSSRVLHFGLGRVVSDAGLLRTLIAAFRPDIDAPNRLGALSHLLSRPAATPAVLTDADVDAIAAQCAAVLSGFRKQQRFDVNFNYTLLIVGGLLRVRERDPWALLADHSITARRLVDELEAATAVIRTMPVPIPNEGPKLALVADLVRALNGAGGSANILSQMDGLDA